MFLTNLPGLYYRLLKTDGSTRVLANPQLRTSEGIPSQANFGERVPVPVTTFAPIAAGGVQTQPITSFNYENIGVNIDITPRTHHDDEVSLAVKIQVSSISGKGFGDLPTFGNRAISTVIRLKDGETNMLAGLIRDDERLVMSGIPGLSDLPLVGRAVRAQLAPDAGNRHHPDADAADRAGSRSQRGRSAAVPCRSRQRRPAHRHPAAVASPDPAAAAGRSPRGSRAAAPVTAGADSATTDATHAAREAAAAAAEGEIRSSLVGSTRAPKR